MTNNYILTMILYRRPDYTRQVIEALEQCWGIDKYRVFFHCEPGHPEVVKIAQESKLNKRIVVNPAQLGCAFNQYTALCDGFAHSDYVIVWEDDIVPARDALQYFEHCGELYYQDPTIWTISAYARTPYKELTPQQHYHYCRRKHFSCWGWATWSDRFREAIRTSWPLEKGDATGSWGRYFQAARGERHELGPLLARTQNIGAEGSTYAHMCGGREWHKENQYFSDGAWGVALDPNAKYHEVYDPNRLKVTW